MHFRAFWQDTGNPHYVWEAMDICAEHKRDFPDWVRGYLDQCARRMADAAQSKASHDLRAILPHVLGFPAKRGPGHPLRPDEGFEVEYMTPAIVFATEILKGCKATEALHSASKFLDQPLADTIDDKTLLAHIKKHFGVKKAPRTNADWKKLIEAWDRETFGGLRKEFRELTP
jgi:hypothetical protein